MSMVGCVIAFFNAKNLPVVLAGLFIKSIGTLPITYMLAGMLADALDHVEWVNGFRCDGFSTSIYSVIATVGAGISAGLFNLGLGLTGYMAPEGTSEQIAQMTQSGAAQTLFSCGVFLIPAIGFFLIILLMIPFKLEKELPKAQAEILQRHIDEAKAQGIEYVSPEERERMEQEELNRAAEEKRIQELKEKCSQKGLDFETEERKYQEKMARKNKKK